MRGIFVAVFLSFPPSLPAGVLVLSLCLAQCLGRVPLHLVLDTVIIIGVAGSWPDRLVNYFQEIARLLALEEATLSTDLQQGYALKSLTGTQGSCSRVTAGVVIVL